MADLLALKTGIYSKMKIKVDVSCPGIFNLNVWRYLTVKQMQERLSGQDRRNK